MTDWAGQARDLAVGDQTPAADEARRDRVVLILACVGQFMVVLDASVVNVALPSIGRALHYSPTGLQWVVNAYVLTFAGFLLLGGRAADIFGRRRAYIGGLALFAGASLLGGMAQSAAWLTTARAVQGVGGALLSPATLTILVTTFKGPSLTKALGLWSATGGAGGATGVVLGGVLTAELSWRWILFINVPIGAITLAVALPYLAERRRRGDAPRLDVFGAVTATGGLAALAYAVVGTDQYGWGSSRTLGALGVSALLLGAFAVSQARVRHPLMPFRLFTSRAVSGANVIMLAVGAAFFSMWYFLSLYLQDVHGYDALRAGVAFTPWTGAIIVGSQLSARFLGRVGVRAMLGAGTLLAAAGFLWMSRIGPGGSYLTTVFGGALLTSFALGLLFTPLAAAATSGVDHSEAGLASGVLNTSRQVGGSIGLAALATIASDRTHGLEVAHHALADALASGYARAFLVACGMCLAGLVATVIVPRRPTEPDRVGRPARSGLRRP